MLLSRWEPFGSMWKEMNRLQREMNQLFHSYGVGGDGWPSFAVSFPALNIWQDEGHVYAEAELPGMELNDLEIYVTGGNQLTIKGERKQPKIAKGTWHRQERGLGSFARVVNLPVDVNADRVEARLTNGILNLTLPKSEAAKPRKITVKAE
jgi:HSP20 family protein